MLFPGNADENDEASVRSEVEQPTRRSGIRPNGVDALAPHEREVGGDRLRRGVAGAVSPLTERPVRDATEIELRVPRREELPLRFDYAQRCICLGRVSIRDAAANA